MTTAAKAAKRAKPTVAELDDAPDLTKASDDVPMEVDTATAADMTVPCAGECGEAAPHDAHLSTEGRQQLGLPDAPICGHIECSGAPFCQQQAIATCSLRETPVAVGPADTFAPAPLPPPGPPVRPPDPLAEALAQGLADGIWTADATAPRSMQTALGFSQLGGDCDRRLMYHLRGVRPINHPDPLRAIIGTGVHLILAEFFRRLDAGTGRYLVEQRLLWQGVPGTVDLFDRRRKVVIDWKTTTMEKIGRYRSQGPTKTQVVQIMGYGAALQSAGETVESVALAFVPTDGTLDDIFVWRAPLDVTVAQRAVERLSNVAQQPFPATASPSALCAWCPFHRPGSTDLTTSCPGKDQTT